MSYNDELALIEEHSNRVHESMICDSTSDDYGDPLIEDTNDYLAPAFDDLDIRNNDFEVVEHYRMLANF